MTFHRRKPDDPVPPPPRVYKYGLPFGPGDARSAELVRRQMLRAHGYQVELSQIMQDGRERYRQIMATVPQVAELQLQVDARKSELKTLRTAISARRAAACSRKVEVPEVPRVAELRLQLKELLKELGAAKKALLDPAIVAAVKASNGRCDAEERQARARVVLAVPENPESPGQPAQDALYWSTYNAVSASVRQACKTPSGPVIRPYWDGNGRVAAQLQGGLKVTDLFKCEDTQLRVAPVNPAVYGTRSGRRNGTRTTLQIRVGSVGRSPVWVSFPMLMHRPLPEEGVIKLAVVTKRRIGTRCRWELHLTVVSEAHRAPAVRNLTAHAALDIGWRARLPGLRVFYLVGSDGHEQELLVPRDIEKRFNKVDELRSRRDQEFDEARDLLRDWLNDRGHTAPAWLIEMTQTLAHWRSIARLSQVVRRWRDTRFDGDQGVFDLMIAWWHHNRHLYQWEANQRQKTIGRRNERYRLLAQEVVRRYSFITLETLDLRPLIKRQEPEITQEELQKTARRNRFIAAPGVFRQILISTAKKHGTVVTTKPCEMTTITCHVCARIDRFDKRELMHTCRHCGNTWDQDQNAAKNLLRSASEEAAE